MTWWLWLMLGAVVGYALRALHRPAGKRVRSKSTARDVGEAATDIGILAIILSLFS